MILAKKSLVVPMNFMTRSDRNSKKGCTGGGQADSHQKGQIIVAYGEVVTDDQYQKLQELGLLKKDTQLQTTSGNPFVCLYHHGCFYIITFTALIRKITIITGTCLLLFDLAAHADRDESGRLTAKIWNGAQSDTLVPVGFGIHADHSIAQHTLVFDLQGLFGRSSASVFFNGDNHLLFDFRYGLVSLVSGMTAAFALSDVRNRSCHFEGGAYSLRWLPSFR